jgi:hypothetical protein
VERERNELSCGIEMGGRNPLLLLCCLKEAGADARVELFEYSRSNK